MTPTLTAVKRVAILSTNGTGRVTGHGYIVGQFAGGLFIVQRDNGRKIGINGALLRECA
jgi:hypothetical protein